MRKKEKITLDDLAVMVKRGFDETATRSELKEIESNLKKEILRLEKEIEELRKDITLIGSLPSESRAAAGYPL